MTDHLLLTRTMRSSHYQEQQHHADGVGVATQRCQKKKTADDDTHHIMKNNHRLHLHHPTVHTSPLRPSRLFSTSITSKSDSSYNHLSTNASDASSSSLIQQLPRQLTKKEETDLRKRIMFQLNTSRSSRRQIENEEDAENLVNYALELITGGELVGTVVEELKFVEMSVCGNVEADNIGIALTEFFTDMSDVVPQRTTRRYSHVASSTTKEEDCGDNDDGIAAIKKKLAAKKKAATKLSPTKKDTREIDEMPPPSPPPPDTISPPLIQKKHAQPLFSSPKMSIDIMTKSHGSPRDVIQAASKEFGFIKDGSADGIFRLHTQWDDMKKTVEMTNNPKPPVDDVDHDDVSFMDNHDTIMDWNEGGEESEFIGDVVEEPYPPRYVFVYGSSSVEGDNRSVVATSSSNVTPLRSEQSTKEDAVQTSQRCSSTSLQVITPVEDVEVSKLLVHKRKKNIKKILEKSRSGFYGGQCQTLATHTPTSRNFSLVDGAGTQTMSETADTALGVVSNLHEHNVEGADVVSNSLKKIEDRNDAQLDITEGRQESSPTVHNNNEVEFKQPTVSDDDDNGPLQQTREQQQARVMKIKTMSEYVAKIDSMRGELMREVEWQHQKQAQMTKIKKMEEYVEKIDSMKGDLLREIKCMKAELQTNSIDDSNDEKKKRDEAKLVVYQLSCRKCKRNHTSYIGTSSLDIKTTLERHFERVVEAVQNKGKGVIASVANDNRVEQWSNDFAMHFARHCQPRFGSKKLISKTDVFNFCIANVKVEVLGSNDMIYGCTVDGKVTASAATRRV